MLASVEKTGRAVVFHSAVEFCGFGAELASILHARLHGKLKAPVARVGARYSPVPFAQGLEAQHFPSQARLLEAARQLMKQG